MLIIRILYTFLLTLISPIFIYGLYKSKPGKPPIGKRWKEHFGLAPKLSSGSNDTFTSTIWIHAVSVGETLAVTPFIRQLHTHYPDKRIVLTTTTTTGAEQANKLGDLVEHRYMPFDLPFAIHKFLKTIQPDHLIIMETELWPNTLKLAHDYGVTVSVINARLSEKSLNNYEKIKPLFNICTKNIDHILCQNQSDLDRFLQLGVKPTQLFLTGSIKYDISISKDIKENAHALHQQLGAERPIWIAASTHEGEDQIILDAHKALLTQHPDVLLILVPRHPERFNDVYSLCINNGLVTHKRTDPVTPLEPMQVYLGNTMGEMLILLGAADICFMGGSLIGDKVGGHNVLEPAALGTPVIIGPSYFNFKDITERLVQHNGIRVLQSNQSDELYQHLNELLNEPQKQKQLAEAASCIVENNRGAITRSLDYLFEEQSA